jgi:hypothetical protein
VAHAALTQADLLTFTERALDPEYVRGLRHGAGYEVLQGYASMAARASLSGFRLYTGCFFRSAGDGAYAVGEVSFFRATATAGAVTIKAGSRVKASATGREYITLDDVVFGALDLGLLSTRVRAVAQGWEYDAREEWTTAGNETVPGTIDTPERLLLDPPYGDASFQVRQIVAVNGGAAPMLDMLGHDRGMLRHPGETAPRYRQRLRQLPDVVSLGAVDRARHATFDRYVPSAEIIETFSVRHMSCLNAPVRCPANPSYDPTAYMYNDPRYGVAGRALGVLDYRAAFIVVVPRLPCLDQRGMILNDPAVVLGQHANTIGGRRAVSAYNLPTHQTLGTGCALGAGDYAKQAVLRGLYDTLTAIKAGGVHVAFVQEGLPPDHG